MIFQIKGVYYAQCDGCGKHLDWAKHCAACSRVRRDVVNIAIDAGWKFKFKPGVKDVQAWCPKCRRGMLKSGIKEK